jgi:CheY-like chemotaxis protein
MAIDGVSGDGRRRRILVINDDPAVLQLFQELLTEEGYDVLLDIFARQTSELLETVRATQPDLVIMDFIIGGEASGWQLLQAARMDRSTRHIPIIVCTAAVRQVTELSTHLDAMGVHVVTKPFDIDYLIGIIDKAWVMARDRHGSGADSSSAESRRVAEPTATEILTDQD